MAWIDYLLAVGNIARNHGSFADKNPVRMLDGPVSDGINQLVYRPNAMPARIFSFYGLTDGRTMLVDRSLSGSYMMFDNLKIKPYEPMETADMVVLPDGRIFVEDRFTNGEGNKAVLKKVKQLAPELYSEFSASQILV
ncbi:MAG: hypothetical protein V1836_04580 [Candidatus Aenigmatarchaeota archaeon]